MQSIESGVSPSLGEFLARAASQIDRLGQDFSSDRSRLLALGERFRAARCHLAVLGQFKRGKSTLINALIGDSVLPAAVVPATSIPTFVCRGAKFSARVLFEQEPERQLAASNGAELAKFLELFVTENSNPHNRLRVRQVEVICPATILRDGLELIDTPGIGSTHRHNTEATFTFLPQCDAALFVLSADPPITELEVEFLKVANRKMARLYFVLNKVDYLDQKDQEAAVAFLQHVLCEQAGFQSPPPIFCTSARDGLAARRDNNPAAWLHSGMAAVEQQIVDFLTREKGDVLTRAIWRQADELLANVQRRLTLTSRALQMPLDELRQRTHRFEHRLTTIEEQRIVAAEKLGRNESQIGQMIKAYADQLLPASRIFFKGVVSACEVREAARWSEESAREAVASAVPDYFDREFNSLQEICQQEMEDALSDHLRRVRELSDDVQQVVGELFDVTFDLATAEIDLPIADRPLWRTHKWTIKFASIPEYWLDRLFPSRWRHLRIRRRIMQQVEHLIVRNVGYIRWNLLEYVRQGFAESRDRLDSRMKCATENMSRAIEVAARERFVESGAAAPKLDRLKESIATVQSLREFIVRR